VIRLTILLLIRPPICLTDIRLREYHIRQTAEAAIAMTKLAIVPALKRLFFIIRPPYV